MEIPDPNGYVNVMWPSTNVPHGGIFHTFTGERSAENQQLLKVLLEESKFDLKLRQTHGFGLRTNNSGRLAAEEDSGGAVVQELSRRPRTSRRRSLSAIRSSGVLDVDMYRPLKRGEDRERMKERLANRMAFGDSAEQVLPAGTQPRTRPAQKLPTPKEMWNELVTQIRERAEWLAEMEWLGEAAPHREIVQEQIAERMRALDALGVESACSSARSTPHSTTRSLAHSTARSLAHSTKGSPAHSADCTNSRAEVRTSAFRGKAIKKSIPIPTERRPKKPEENVTAYSQLSPLGYTPRRRV